MTKQIIVVDDEKIVCSMLEILLKNHLNCEVETFSEPEEALSYIQANSHEVGLVLSDLRMPDIDGLDLCKRISEIDAKIPMILFTAYLNKEVERTAASLGVKEVLSKPVDSSYLASVIQKYLPSSSSSQA